LSRDKVEEY